MSTRLVSTAYEGQPTMSLEEDEANRRKYNDSQQSCQQYGGREHKRRAKRADSPRPPHPKSAPECHRHFSYTHCTCNNTPTRHGTGSRCHLPIFDTRFVYVPSICSGTTRNVVHRSVLLWTKAQRRGWARRASCGRKIRREIHGRRWRNQKTLLSGRSEPR